MPRTKKTKPKEIGACGNYCGECQDFLALKNNDNQIRKQVQENIAKEMGFYVPLEEVGCDGCWGKIHNAWTASLDCEVRTCVEKKGYTTCAECKEFPCLMYANIFGTDSEYCRHILEIKKYGLDKWLAQKNG